MGIRKSKKKAPKVSVRDIQVLVGQADAMLVGVLQIIDGGDLNVSISQAAARKRFDRGCPPPSAAQVKRFDRGCPPPLRVERLGTSGGRRDGIAVGARKRLRHAKLLVDTAVRLLPIVAKSQAAKGKKDTVTPRWKTTNTGAGTGPE